MELLTFAEAKDARELKNVSGVCSSSDEFKSLLNQAVRKLMNRGSWWGCVQKIQICTYGNKVVWPRFVGTVLALNYGGAASPVKNNWYDFLPMSRCDFGPGGIFPFLNGTFGPITTVDAGFSPVFNPINCGIPVYIQVYPGTRADIGKKTTIYGVDSYGQTVRTKDAGGIWVEGETVVIAAPYSQTKTLWREVTRIAKGITQGVARYYQFEPIGPQTYDLVWLEPGEKNPMYRSDRLPPGRTCCLKSIQALVKLEFIPVVADTDIVQISNLDALALMISAIRDSNAGDKDKARAGEVDAVRELNLELRNRTPNDQISTQVQYFGTARLQRQRIGSLV